MNGLVNGKTRSESNQAVVGSRRLPAVTLLIVLGMSLVHLRRRRNAAARIRAYRYTEGPTGNNPSVLDGRLIDSIYRDLLPGLEARSINPRNPVQVQHVPTPWNVLSTGNYATVLYHPDYPDLVVKVYAPGRPGFEEEREVYRRLGSHPAFSECLYAGDNFLVLKRLYGVTLYDSINLGLPIPIRVIHDIDKALAYARSRGLYPHDVHGRNVMMRDGRGLVVDVSDFLKEEDCQKWNDLKKAYYRFYRPIILPLRLRAPLFLLDLTRKIYHRFRGTTGDYAYSD